MSMFDIHTKQEKTMSEAPLKATLKAGSDYSAPWLTIDGSSPDELETRLKAVAAGGLTQALIEAANALKAANNAAPLLAGGEQAPQQEQAQPKGWGQSAPQQQNQQQPRQQGWQAPATTHPEGLACDMCNKPLEFKKTGNGKSVWRCPDWRWNNGTPNGHAQEWA